MTRIRKIEIQNFRAIRSLTWFPDPGLNCLVGPGDSGKSTVLEAVDLCVGSRRSPQFSDADFHRLNLSAPIRIAVTVGELADSLKSIESYGTFLQGYDDALNTVEDEPGDGLDTALTVVLTVRADLEPTWELYSARAQEQGLTRTLSWADRQAIAPTRIGALAGYHLGWQRGSVLNRVSDERVDVGEALIEAARGARAAFGDAAATELRRTCEAVEETAKELGITPGASVRAMLDAQSVSFSGGTIALHDANGVPLRSMGTGSTRLLIAGLQRRVASTSTIVLVDELEFGLEPHRVIRLLGSLGAREKSPPLQVFMTTHSSVAVRELSADQLFVLRVAPGGHEAKRFSRAGDIQGTVRLYPESFLAHAVVVCEGASEVGLLRGLDRFRCGMGAESLFARGVALIDSEGGTAERPFERAEAFLALGYQTAVVRDDDKPPAPHVEGAFEAKGGKVIRWDSGRALEDELFIELPDAAVGALLERAIQLHGEKAIDEHIRSASDGKLTLDVARSMDLIDGYDEATRAVLGKAARTKKQSWFKKVGWMDDVAHDIVAPALTEVHEAFRRRVTGIFAWAGCEG